MANDKKFIVKNGLLTPENAVIGSTTDTGEKLQVTGDSVLTQGTQATPTLKVTNSGGHSAGTIIAQFEGDSDSLEIRNISEGDYKITNPGVDNSIEFHDDTSGIVINYAGSEIAAFTSTGINFTGVATTTIDNNRILTTADEGSGNLLDADSVDGLEASQFLRSDVADTAARTITFQEDIDVAGAGTFGGNITVDGQAIIKSLLDAQANAQIAGDLTVSGDFTVSGNTTYVNTEEILLSDNIITLNANYTGSTPSQDSGIEIERGTLANPKLVWNESQDYWQLEVNGGVLGRVITTADEGSGNGFDADTVDGLEAAQFLRSDADDTATGNITIEGDLTVGDGVGAAQITLDTSGQSRTIYADNGTVGFLGGGGNYAASSDGDGDFIVARDVEAGRNVVADDDVTATAGNISATAGSVSAGTTVTGGTGVIATTGNVSATIGDVTAGNDVIAAQDVTATAGDVTAGNDVVAAQDVTATAGNISATAGDVTAGDSIVAENNITATSGNISATAGSVAAGTTVSAGTTVTGGTGVIATTGNVSASAGDVVAQDNVTATTGNVTATAGDVIAGDDVTAQNNITATTGNISATAGSVSAGTTVTAGTDVIGQRFVDADNNSYVVNPASDSIMHAIGIDDDLYHNGDTDTKLSFATDTVDIDTGGSTRLTANNSGVTVTGDLDVTGNLTAVDGTFSGDLSASRFLDSDNNTYLLDPDGTSVLNRVGIDDYIQHNDDTNTFFGFDSNDNIIFTTNAVERLEINATNITGTVDAIFPDVYAGRFYDLNNATYYVDPASNSRMSGIGLVGTIFHDGDTNTYLNFNAADSFEIVTGGTQGLQVATFTTAAGSVRSPLFYDVDDTNYYGDFAGTSQMSQIDIDSYIRHRGDTNNYFGFDAADSQTFVTNAVERLNITDANSTFTHDVIVQGDVQANRFVDRNATGYFVHPGDTTLAATFAGAVRIENITNNSRWDDTTGNGGIALMGYGDGNGSTSNPSFAMSGNYSGGYALMYLNRIDASNNPTNDGNRYIAFGADGTNYSTIRGDAQGNMYQVLASGKNWGFWTSGYSEALIVDDNLNVMVANSTAPTYTTMDNTPLIGAVTTNRLHVGGSIQLANNDDAIVFGRGTASFMKDEELGFGWGSGLYMLDATYLRIRNNTTLYSTGNADFNQFRSTTNTAYYVDPDGDSQLNTVDIDDWIRHRGDTNTYIGFPAADQIELTTGGGIRGQINNTRTRVRNKLEVYGSGIELQKDSNGAGVGITMTDQGSTETPGLAALEQASIKVWHSDNSVTTGAGLAMVFDSSEASTHYVFSDTNGTVGGTLIPRVTNQGNLGLSTYRWSNVYAQTGNYSGNITASNMYAQRFYDSNDNTYYADPASTSIFNVLNLENHAAPQNDWAPIQINNGNATGDIDTPESWIQFAFADSNANFTPQVRIGARAGTVGSADNLDKEGSGNFIVETAIGSGGAGAGTLRQTFAVDYLGNSLSLTSSRAPIFYDSDNTTYFANPGAESRLATIKLEDGVILRSPNGTFGSLTVSGTGRGGYEGFSINDRVVFMHNNANTSGIYNDVNNHWLFRGENGGETAMYYNGSQQLRALNGYALADNQMRSPIFYDSNDTAYYGDFASTTRVNAIQALRYYFNHATTYYADAASGDYGSMEVGGTKGGWAGYSIAGQWNFMSDGVTNAGIYNDTDNKWATRYYRNSHVELMFNDTWEGRTESGYFRARQSFRAPIFYDIDDTTYFGDFASRSKLKTLELGNQGNLTGSGVYPLGIYHNNRYLIGMRNSAADTNYPWLVHDNYNFNGVGSKSAFIVHFNGIADRLRLTEDGNMLIDGEMAASGYNLSGGNENISLSKLYTRGAADETLFDGTMYFEKRVIQAMQGAENPTTSDTNEFVKSPDAPGSSSYVLRTAAFRNFYSDYIEVEPGEQLFGEIHQKTISGSGGLFYYGIERFDKDKNPISGNTGTTYFVVGGATPTQTTWQTYRAHHTLPTSHTPYNGSDGQGVRYVRIRVLYNYPSGGALREFTMPILKRVNYHSNIKTDYDVYASRLYSGEDTSYYVDPNSTSLFNAVTADRVDSNIFYDRGNTAYYMVPDSNSNTVKQTMQELIVDGGTRNNTNDATAYFSATNNNDWGVVINKNRTNATEYGLDVRMGSSHTYGIRLLAGGTERMRSNNTALYHWGSMRAPIFYDLDDTGWYTNQAGTSRHNIQQANFFTNDADVSDTSQFGLYFGDNRSTAYAIYKEGGAWTNPYPDLRIAFHTGIKMGANASYNGMRFYNDYDMATQVMSINNSSDPLGGNNVFVNNSLQANSSLRAPIFYDSNDTNYYVDPATNGRLWQLGVGYRAAGKRLDVTGDHGNTAIRLALPAANNGLANGEIALQMWVSEPGNTWDGAGFGYNVDNNLNANTNVYYFGRPNTGLGQGYMRFTNNGYTYFYNTNTSGTRYNPMQTRSDNTVYFPNYAFAGASLRAPLFYDTDDTAYYGNYAGDTNWQGLSARGQAMIGLPGHTRSGAISNYGRRPNITGDTNYWTGSKGWGNVNMNTVAHWGSGFFDTWGNPANQPSGTSHWVGVQAYHYSNGGTQHGWQLAGGPISNLRFRNSWSSFSAWRTVPMMNVNDTGNGGNFYAQIYYDSQNPAYYGDFASTSNMNTVQINGTLRFMNYGLGVTGTYTSTRLQTVFNMDDQYSINAAGTATQNAYGLYWSHPNAGSLGGANNLNDHGLLIINNGGFRAAISSRAVFSSDVRGTIFYDYNNTGYYADLQNNTRMNTLLANRVYPCYDNDTGIYLDYPTGNYGSVQINGAGKGGWEGLSFDGRFVMMTSDSSVIGLYNDTDNEWMQLWYRNSYTSIYYNGTWEERSGSGYMYARGSYRAPIFYDQDDTGYYYDPNSTSNSAGRQRGGTLYGPNPSWGRYLYVGTNGNVSSEACVAATNGNLHLDSRSGNNLYLQWYNSGTVYVNNSIQSPIYYDRNNTSYYGDFASTSYMNDVRANIFYERENTAYYFGSGQGDARFRTTRVNECYNDAWFRNYNAGQGLYNQATGRHFYSPGGTYWHIDSGAGLIFYGSYQGSQGTGTDRKGYIYHSGAGFGLLNSAGSWQFRIDPGNSNAEVYRTLFADSIQANILYDRNNTGYYFNGASTNSTRFEGVSNRTKAMMGLPGHTRNSAEYYSARPRITSDTNYWTGAMGWGRQDMNVVSTFGSGFIDSWSSPPNMPAGASHWVGTQAYHYRSSNTNGYGFQLVGGPIENLRLRSSWPGWRAWRTVPVLDVNNQNGGSMYAGRYYDSNNTGYYMDPYSTSRVNVTEQLGRMYFSNYVVSRGNGGMMGSYNSTGTAAKVIWTIGESWPIGNMYGLAYAYDGSYGHHLSLRNNGSTYHRISFASQGASLSGTWQTSSSFRAPIFYDSNNTGYYFDGNTSGTSVRIAGDVLCDANYGKGWVGVYSSVRYQNVFSMGGAYRLPANGTTTGNLYGMAWSHPNRGGAAGNLDSHGLLILINGGFGSAMSYSIRASGNITAYSDERLKTNWRPMPEDFVSQLAEVRVGIYDRTDGQKLTQVGVSAQSLQTVLPEAITAANDDIGTLSVNYGGAALASAVELAKAIKEQRTIINNQQQEINDLKDMVSALMNKLS